MADLDTLCPKPLWRSSHLRPEELGRFAKPILGLQQQDPIDLNRTDRGGGHRSKLQPGEAVHDRFRWPSGRSQEAMRRKIPRRDRPRRLVMLGLLAALALASAFVPAAADSAGPDPVTPVAAVDLQRYAGFWYEIARVPAWFQSRCERRSIARYRLRSDGRLAVLNQCIKRSGNVEQAEGIARVVDPVSRARLQVSLVSLLGWRPFWGDYWILGLDPDYRWAVVGDPRRRYGWILSRTPSLEPATLETIFGVLERNGYRRSRFVLTPQSP